MKFIAMGLLMSFAAAVGCMSSPDDAPVSDEAQLSTDRSVDQAADQATDPSGGAITLGALCTKQMGTCETGQLCKRVGVNIGKFDCTGTLICCR